MNFTTQFWTYKGVYLNNANCHTNNETRYRDKIHIERYIHINVNIGKKTYNVNSTMPY